MGGLKDLFRNKEKETDESPAIKINMEKLTPEEKLALISMVDSKKKRDDNKLVEVE